MSDKDLAKRVSALRITDKHVRYVDTYKDGESNVSYVDMDTFFMHFPELISFFEHLPVSSLLFNTQNRTGTHTLRVTLHHGPIPQEED